TTSLPLREISLETGKVVREWSETLPPGGRLALAPDGRHLALERSNMTVWILRLAPPPADGNPGVAVELFAVLANGPRQETRHATLSDAVKAARSGDTIEIRGDGPFMMEPVPGIDKPLAIKAATGFRPILTLAADKRGGL